jgi:hypothetical protein
MTCREPYIPVADPKSARGSKRFLGVVGEVDGTKPLTESLGSIRFKRFMNGRQVYS